MFAPDLVDAAPGPAWLQGRRRRALGLLAGAALPSTDEEVWRYSRVGDLDPAAFRPTAGPAGAAVPEGAAAVLAGLPERAGAVVVVDGTVAHLELDDRWAGRGVALGPLDEPLPAALGDPVDVFALANEAFGHQPLALRVPAGVELDAPVVVVDWVEAEGSATFPRLVVEAGPGAAVAVVDWQGSAPGVRALSLPVLELDLARGARLAHVGVQDRGHRMWQVASQVATVGQEATLTSVHAGLGGDYARVRTDCRLAGRGASGDLLAAYFGEGDQMLDYRTFQDHIAPDTTSNLLFKGAVGGTSQSVYTGLIHVGAEARGTNAFQTNRNLKLSDGAWAESVPNLEIENNDVRCSHASTVGPVDPDQRFYLESRGVPRTAAERLLVTGFFAEVLERVPVPAVARLLALEIDRRLVAGRELEGVA